jgi:hypothetical protein
MRRLLFGLQIVGLASDFGPENFGTNRGETCVYFRIERNPEKVEII